MNSMMFGFALVVSVAPRDIAEDFAPLRIIGWNEINHYDQFPCLDSELDQRFQKAEYRVRLRQGEALIRDCRVCHGGTPNHTDEPRFLPGIQVLSPQYTRYEANQRNAKM